MTKRTARRSRQQSRTLGLAGGVASPADRTFRLNSQSVFCGVAQRIPFRGRRNATLVAERGNWADLHDRNRNSGPPVRLYDPFDIDRMPEMTLDLSERLPYRIDHFIRQAPRRVKPSRKLLVGDGAENSVENSGDPLVADPV